MIKICLPAKASDDLQWKLDTPKEGKILWELDLGFRGCSFDDPFCLQNHLHAARTFTDLVWPNYAERSEAIVLYRGSPHLSWLPEDDPIVRLEKMVGYVRLLAVKLPDELPIRLVFETETLNAEVLHLLAPERFEHLEIDVPFMNDAKIGICFPEEVNEEVLQQMNGLLKEWQGKEFRVVYESFLTEQWHGLDELIVLEGTMGERGERKLRGFEAAGGKCKFRGRGI